MPGLRGVTTASTGASTTLLTYTINNPSWNGSSTPALDIILLWVTLRGAIALNTPAGFTAVPATVVSSGQYQLFYRITDGTEGATFTISWASGANVSSAMARSYFGADTALVMDPAVPASSAISGLAASSITTTRDGDMLVWFAATKTSTAGQTPGTITPPSGFTGSTPSAATTTVADPNVQAYGADEVQAAHGATGTLTGTDSTPAVDTSGASVVVALAAMTPIVPGRRTRSTLAPVRRSSVTRPAFIPVVTVTVPIVPAPVRTRRVWPRAQRGRITTGIVVTVTATPPPIVPATIRTRRPLSRAVAERGGFAPPVVVTATVTVPVVLARVRTRRFFPRTFERGGFAPPVVITVTAATAPVVPAVVRTRRPAWRPPSERGGFAPPVVVTVTVAPAPIVPVPVRSKRRPAPRVVRSAFRRGFTVIATAVRHPLDLGGTQTDENRLGGSIVVRPIAPYGGSIADENRLGGTATNERVYSATASDENRLGGTSVRRTSDSIARGWTMQAVSLAVGEFNDETIDLTLTSGGSALDLTAATIDVYLKTAAGISDTDPSTIHLSTGTGEVVVTNAVGGLATVSIAAATLGISAAYGFWRVDVVKSSKRNTALYGNVTITKL